MFMHGTRRKFSRLLSYRETHGELGCLLQQVHMCNLSCLLLRSAMLKASCVEINILKTSQILRYCSQIIRVVFQLVKERIVRKLILGSTLTSKIKDNGSFQGQCVLDPGLCLLANRGVVHHLLQSGGGGAMTREPTRILHLKQSTMSIWCMYCITFKFKT